MMLASRRVIHIDATPRKGKAPSYTSNFIRDCHHGGFGGHEVGALDAGAWFEGMIQSAILDFLDVEERPRRRLPFEKGLTFEELFGGFEKGPRWNGLPGHRHVDR